MTKALKTPLRYPGGKSKALTKLFQFIPDLTPYSTYVEPFLGGGSVALEVTKRYPNITVRVSDKYEPLVNFWIALQKFPEELTDTILKYKHDHDTPDKAKKLFDSCKDNLYLDLTNGEKAAAFYVLNKCSFSGLTESSSFSKQASESNFSVRGIEKLPEYSKIIKDWVILPWDYEFVLKGSKDNPIRLSSDTFIYLDPPYDIKDNLYGKNGGMHKSFDHNQFAELIQDIPFDTLISYNSDQLVKDRFENWQSAEFDHTYTMRSVGDYMSDQNSRKELVLSNYVLDGSSIMEAITAGQNLSFQ
jgi:site-specific DNA-adenine methylase